MAYLDKNPKPKNLRLWTANGDKGFADLARRLVDECVAKGEKILALNRKTLPKLKACFCLPRESEAVNLSTGEAVEFPPLLTEAQFAEWVVGIKSVRRGSDEWKQRKNPLTGEELPLDPNHRLDAQFLTAVLGQLDFGTVVFDEPAPWLEAQCSHLPIDFCAVDDLSWDEGLFRRGEEPPPEDVFTPLADWEIPEQEEIVEGHVILGGVHVFAGLFESFKTMAGLELESAVLEGRKAFGRFKVNEKYAGTGGVWVNCDMSHGLFLSYARNWKLDEDPRFVSNSPKAAASFSPDSPALRKSVRGKILCVDTMLDLARIKDANQSAEWIEFFAKIRALINECGCLAVVLISHPTKSGARSSVVDPTEYLKDSVTFGGKIDVGFGFRRCGDDEVHVERIKGRSFQGPLKYSLAIRDENGDSWISRGRFPVVEEGRSLYAKLKSGKGPGKGLSDEAKALLADARKKGLSSRKAADELKAKLGEGAPSDSTVFRWWKALDEQEKLDF